MSAPTVDEITALMHDAWRGEDADLDPTNGEANPFPPYEAEVHANGNGAHRETKPDAGLERGSFDERFSSRKVDLQARVEHGIPPAEYLPASEGMLRRGKRHLLPAPQKTGKSLTALIHACDIALAGGHVVILDRENGADEYAKRLGEILASRGLDDEQRATVFAGIAYYQFPSIRQFDDHDLASELNGADLVIFDSQRRFLTDLGLDEDKSDDYATFTAITIDVLFAASIATLILDNTGHMEKGRARGSSAKGDLNEVTFTLKTVEPFSLNRVGKLRLSIEPGASRFGNEGTWEMTIGAGVYGSWERVADPEDDAATERDEKQQDAATWIVDYVNQHPGAARTTVENAFADQHGRGGRTLARKAIDQELTASKTASTPRLAKGKGQAANGVYLYPALQASLPLAEASNGEHREHPSESPPDEVLASSPPPLRRAASGEHSAKTPLEALGTVPLGELHAMHERGEI